MIPTVTIDFETRSEVGLTKAGAQVYSQHPSTEIICACWGIDDKPIQEWWPSKHSTAEMPADLHSVLDQRGLVEAHNVSFEYFIWKHVLAERLNWPMPRWDTWRDTMAVACYYAMPAELDRLARVLGFGGKDPEGARLITKYSKLYLKTAKRIIPPEDFAKFVKYCVHDVAMEQSVSDYLGDLPEHELENFLLNQKMNRRGLYLDAPGIACATEIVDERALELGGEFERLTGFRHGQRDRVMEWFRGQGIILENMQKDYLAGLMEEGDIPQGAARRALEIRSRINKASTKKLDKMAAQRGRDGCARYQTRYHGTFTGRPTGGGFQPLNLSRGFEHVPPEQLVKDIMYRDARWLDFIYGDAMDAVAKAARHWIMAKEGYRIMSGDFASVEAVGLACLAGEGWKVQAFRDGVKIYEHMGDKIHGLASGTVTKSTHPAERQDGKTGELAFGYQGALNAWLKFDNSGRHTDERIIEICKAWRAEHPAIVDFWHGLNRAAIEAVRHPGRTTGCNDIGFQVVDRWLTMILPDGKRPWYCDPQLRLKMPQWHQPETREDCREGTCRCEPRRQVSYMAWKNKQWRRVYTYGGKLAENATQAACRQLMQAAAQALERYQYPMILTVYDEAIAQVPLTHGTISEFEEIMVTSLPPFAERWPIRAEVWEGSRYRK